MREGAVARVAGRLRILERRLAGAGHARNARRQVRGVGQVQVGHERILRVDAGRADAGAVEEQRRVQQLALRFQPDEVVARPRAEVRVLPLAPPRLARGVALPRRVQVRDREAEALPLLPEAAEAHVEPALRRRAGLVAEEHNEVRRRPGRQARRRHREGPAEAHAERVVQRRREAREVAVPGAEVGDVGGVGALGAGQDREALIIVAVDQRLVGRMVVELEGAEPGGLQVELGQAIGLLIVVQRQEADLHLVEPGHAGDLAAVDRDRPADPRVGHTPVPALPVERELHRDTGYRAQCGLAVERDGAAVERVALVLQRRGRTIDAKQQALRELDASGIDPAAQVAPRLRPDILVPVREREPQGRAHVGHLDGPLRRRRPGRAGQSEAQQGERRG